MTLSQVTRTLSQEMVVENDSLIITDPCYILKDEDWESFLNVENDMNLDEYLRQNHNFGEVIANNTGVGDWSNSVYRTESKEQLGRFAADAGMLIVCTASDIANYGTPTDELQRLHNIGCLAVVPDFTGKVTLVYDTKDDTTLGVVIGISSEDNSENWSTETFDY